MDSGVCGLAGRDSVLGCAGRRIREWRGCDWVAGGLTRVGVVFVVARAGSGPRAESGGDCRAAGFLAALGTTGPGVLGMTGPLSAIR